MNGQYGPVPGNPYAQPQPQSAPQPAYGQPSAYAPPQPAPPAYAPSFPPPHHNPEFLAADSRSGIVVDENGVTFDFEGQSAEFPWSEIQSIHSKPGVGGHRLMVAVVLPGGKFYECGVKARSSATLNHWFRDLGHVLSVYLGSRDNPPLSPH
ncbi:hypothetical protein [Streptomyces niveus]|uniref:hypothetical protein n=1 Tax=Streptomyces niveus TaxID=193462 RepID=UPI0003C57F6A|nr:hypothetical protein [Streptomyces niveus]EST28820.1 hypothetical protein M877_13840 [Streptomyces niveus NCIMB 11891]